MFQYTKGSAVDDELNLAHLASQVIWRPDNARLLTVDWMAGHLPYSTSGKVAPARDACAPLVLAVIPGKRDGTIAVVTLHCHRGGLHCYFQLRRFTKGSSCDNE